MMAKSKKDPNFPMQGKGGNMGGRYARKAQNLSGKQLGKSGRAAAAKRTVDISQTSRDTSKGVTLGPGGKPLTGTVKMGNGNTAVYKNGKRVVAAKPAKAAPVSSRNRSASGSSSSAPAASRSSATARRAQNAGVKDGTVRTGAGKRYVREYNSKTGRWDKVDQTAGASVKKVGTTTSKPAAAKPKATVSPTVAAAVAQGKKAGKGSGNGVPAGDNQGYVRGNPYAQQSAVTAKRTGRTPMPGTVQAQTKNKKDQDRRNQGRDAALIAGLTVGAAAGAAGLAARGAGAAASAVGRKAIEAGGRKAVTGGRPAGARVTIERVGQGTRGTTPRPQGAKPTPRKAITSNESTGAMHGPARPTPGQAKYAANERKAYDRRQSGQTTQGVSKATGGAVVNRKPATYGPSSLTPQQKAALTRYKKAQAASRAKKK